jgi:hypothetical protein
VAMARWGAALVAVVAAGCPARSPLRMHKLTT